MAETENLLKVDVAGRVWTPCEAREAVLDEFERSGMSGPGRRAASGRHGKRADALRCG